MNLKWILRQHEIFVKTWIKDRLPRPLLQENETLHGRHAGRRCFILGSGHSILEQDLKPLEKEIVFTQNHFHAHPDIGRIRPDYHVTVPKYQGETFDEDWGAWLAGMEQKLPAETEFFWDENTRYLVERFPGLAHRSYFLRAAYPASVLKSAPVDLTRAIMKVPTVLTECLAIAIYMGFGEIFLLGFDLDQICRMHDRDRVRFYGNSPVTDNQAERDAEKKHVATGSGWIQRWEIWQQCHLLKEAAEANNQRILNATRGGLLDVFERCRYEEVLGLEDPGA